MSPHPRPCLRILLTSAALAAGVTFLAGCKKPLLSPDDERSQFDRYDAIRNQRAQQSVYDEFGRKRPNLRGRLLSKD
jgi:hypothetical protein